MPQTETIKGHNVELLAERPASVPAPDYSDKELSYWGALKPRLMEIRDLKEGPHEIFDGLGVTQYCTENRKAANTFVKPRANDTETTYVTGTTRQKLYFYLATVNNLDLSPDIQAFDQDNQLDVQVGETMEDIDAKIRELDSDDEKRLHRQYVMFEQGTVFVEEIWDVCKKKMKTLSKSIRDYDGTINGIDWTERLAKLYERPSRNILRNESVYLGDETQYFMDDQPDLFTVDVIPYGKAKAIFGTWERWKNVPSTPTNEAQQEENAPYSQNWRLTDVKSGFVEVIKYQNRWDDDYQIILNGVMMLPVGFPLSAIWANGRYGIEKQVLEYIPNSAYGKSFPSRLKHAQALLDEMIRLAVLKTQTSFKPPRANNTGRVVSSKVFGPGTITAGIDPRSLPVLAESQGITPSEQTMIQMLFKEADANSVDPMVQGQGGGGDVTATEVVTLKSQADKMLGITVFVASLLEQKLTYLRIDNIIQNFFDPVDTKANVALKTIRNKYRSIAIAKSIDGEGQGVKMIRVTEADQIPTADEIYTEEQQLKNQLGMPVRIAYVEPAVFQRVRYEWRVVITPREKRTSELAKLTFDQFVQRIAGLPGLNVDWPYLGKRYAEMYRENPDKIFSAGGTMPMQPGTPTPGMPGTPPAVTQLKNQPSLGMMKNEGQL